MKTLDPLPGCIGFSGLKDADVQRLKDEFGDKLPKSPWPCITCGARDVEAEHTFLGVDGDRYECDCKAQWKLHRYLLHCGVPDLYMRYGWGDAATVDNQAQNEALQYAMKFAEYAHRGVGMIFWGAGSGTGKTLLASLLFKKVIGGCYDGYYATFSDMLDIYQSTWRSDEQRRWYDQRVRNAGVLLIDDIGREMAGRLSVAETAFENLLRNRVQHNRPTIITSNYTMEKLMVQYGRNVGSLLTESFKSVEVPGQDKRKSVLEQTEAEITAGITRPVVLW